jgi:large subunit ribosomal protein L28
MAQECDVCGKTARGGNKVTTRGKAKYLGGVGTKITGINRRRFRPNLQRVRVTTANGTHKTVRVCTQCIRSGAITKTIRNAPFRLPSGESTPKPKGEASKSKSTSGETK